MNKQFALLRSIDIKVHQVSTIAFNRFGIIGFPNNCIGDWDAVGVYGRSGGVGLSRETTFHEFDIISYIGAGENLKQVSKNKALGYIG